MKNKFTIEREKEIVRLYKVENKNTNELAKLFGTYNTSIRRILIRHNVNLRSYGVAQRKVSLEDIKSKVGTPDFDYFLGLLATDGCITGNRVVLDFCEDNKELLNYWNKFLGNKCTITCSIHKQFHTPQYRIAFRNSEVCEFLESYGIVPRKTFDLKLKYINWDVLRGIIDGDGCISLTNKKYNLIRIGITSACENFLLQIQEFLIGEGIFSSRISESDRNKSITYDLLIDKSEDVLTIYDKLYSNAHFFLKRKEEKFGPLLKKFNRCSLVNSGKENENSNPEPCLTEEGVETIHEEPKVD